MPCWAASCKTEHPLSILSYRTLPTLPPLSLLSLSLPPFPPGCTRYCRAQYHTTIPYKKIPVQDRREILSIEEKYVIYNTAINYPLRDSAVCVTVCERGCFYFAKIIIIKSVSVSLSIWISHKSATEARILKKCRESE